jgi:hypothetical protein
LNVNLLVDDGTAQIDVVVWPEPDKAANSAQWREGTYVRVVGHLRTAQDPSQRNFITDFTKVRPIEDFNEITYHLLEAVSVHLQNVRGGEGSFGQGGPYLDSLILSVIRDCRDEDGASVDYIMQQLAHVTQDEAQVRHVLKNVLEKESHIYPGKDDNHFKAA